MAVPKFIQSSFKCMLCFKCQLCVLRDVVSCEFADLSFLLAVHFNFVVYFAANKIENSSTRSAIYVYHDQILLRLDRDNSMQYMLLHSDYSQGRPVSSGIITYFYLLTYLLAL